MYISCKSMDWKNYLYLLGHVRIISKKVLESSSQVQSNFMDKMDTVLKVHKTYILNP